MRKQILLIVLVLTIALLSAACLPVTEQDPRDVAATLDARGIHKVPTPLPTATVAVPEDFRVAYDSGSKVLTIEKLGFSDVSASFALYHPDGVATQYSGKITRGKYSISEVEMGSILILSGEKFVLNTGLTAGFTQERTSIK